jgi:cytochrome c oxidase assembly factor CtaG
MSINGVLVLVFGVTLYFIGRWRKKREGKARPGVEMRD